MIRLAVPADIEVLRDIEDAAGRFFAEIGMDFVADDEAPPAATLLEYVRDERIWVWADPAGRVVAYLMADVVDGCAHVEQVSVHPDYAHRRIGLALLNHLIGWARRRGLPAVTLTTYTEVPWNGPYYRRCGFLDLPEAELTPGLRAIRAAEAEHGLDRWPRTAMRRDL